jgi:ankyrin repeat protein
MFSFLLQNEYLGTILAPPRQQGPSIGELKLLLKAGKLSEAQELLDRHSNVPLSDNESIDNLSKDGLNVLHVACAANAISIVIELINTRGAKVNVQSSSGNTPLHYAAVNGHGNLVDVLLRYGADQSLPNHAGEIAADLWTGGKGSSLLQNRSEVTDRMLSPTALFHKRTLELNSSIGGSASSPSVISPARLHQQVLSAAQETAEAMSEELSYRNYSKLVFKKIEEQPPDLSTIRALLRRDPSLALSRTAGSDLFGIGFNDGFTPLHAAAFYGHCDVIALLLEHDRVNAWVRDLQGKTPLHIAAERGHAAACQHLREAMKAHSGGVDPVGTDAPLDLSGRTPMGCFSKTETVTKERQLAMRAVIFSPGDRSVLPRSPVPERSGCSPWRLPTSQSPHPAALGPGHRQGQDQGQEHQFVYAFSEACGFKRQMEDQIVLRCPLEPVAFPSWSIFGVCDGHGGSACSKYLARRFPTVLEWAASQAPSSSSSSSSSAGAVPAHESKDAPDTLRHILGASCAAIEAEMKVNPAFHIDVYRRHEDSGQPSLVSFLDSAASGSTGIFCLATLRHLAVANVGDSRAVLAQFGGQRPPAPPSDDALVSPRPGEGSTGGHSLVAVPLSRDQKLGAAEQERALKAGAT